MIDVRTIGVTPARLRFALGYSCTCAWAVVLLLSPAFGMPDAVQATSASMLPGLVACLGSIFFSRRLPSITGRTGFVTIAALLMAVGTFLCTYPPSAELATTRIAGLALSGFFAIIVIMSWFDTYARLNPRAVIILAGCAISIAALMCWLILASPEPIASALTTLLPLISLAMLPSVSAATANQGEGAHGAAMPPAPEPTSVAQPGLLNIMAAAVPIRTLVGLAITFFIVSSIGSLAPTFGLFSNVVTPLSLVAPLGVTVFFVASALLAQRQIDPSILYKILLSAFAAGVFLLMLSIGISASLVFYANIVAEVMMWVVLALWAKKTPVKPHLVFAIGWIAECVGNTAGQTLSPLFASHIETFYLVAIMLILVAVGFAFSEGSLVLDIDFEDDEGEQQARMESSDGPSGPRTAARGYDVLSTAAQKGDAASDPLDTFAAAHDLSPREHEVLALWITGHGLKYIENALFISESTVKSHLRNIYRKCDTHNRAEIIALFEHESGLNA